MLYIYTLLLKQGKYYIGKSKNPVQRIVQHNEMRGSAWTRKYPPISVMDVIPNCSSPDEDKYTIEYMSKYGIQNVRGGSFTQLVLSDANIKTLEQMIRGSNDVCFLCGSKTHFAKQCPTLRTPPHNTQ